MRLTTRIFLAASVVGLTAFAQAACGSSSDSGSSGGTGDEDGGGGGSTTDGGNHPRFEAGSTGDTDSGDAGATALDIPIKHIVVVVKENHTFDNYFGTFPGAEGTLKTLPDGGTSNQCMTSTGVIECPHAQDPVPYDMCHAHDCAITAWDNGKMDGMDSVMAENASADPHQPYGQYYESDIPNYWLLAKDFTLADHFFSGMLGPSFPGHLFTLAAQAGWAIGNPNTQYTHPYWGCDQTAGTLIPILDQNVCAQQNVFPCFKIPSIPDILPKGITWKFYGTKLPLIGTEPWTMFDAVNAVRYGAGWSNVVLLDDQLKNDIAANALPNVSWIVDQDTNSEHPNPGNFCPGNLCSICNGENWTVHHINMIMNSPYWKDTAILITYDDWGGWYDHVPPPRQYGNTCTTTSPPPAYGLGFRLPLIIVSPYAKPHFVFKEASEQASIAHFIEKVFGSTQTLHDIDPAAQDKQANDLLGAFDFNQLPLPAPQLTERNCP
jgi:phospholipase C